MMIQINSVTIAFSFWSARFYQKTCEPEDRSYFRLDLSSLKLNWKWTILGEFKQDFDVNNCLQYSVLVQVAQEQARLKSNYEFVSILSGWFLIWQPFPYNHQKISTFKIQ